MNFAARREAPGQEGVDPAVYPWSSYPHHIGLRSDPLITDHALYWGLGNTPFQREAAYKALCERALTAAQTKEIEGAVLTGWPLGGKAFKDELARKTSRQVTPAKRGRPFKIKHVDSVPN